MVLMQFAVSGRTQIKTSNPCKNIADRDLTVTDEMVKNIGRQFKKYL